MNENINTLIGVFGLLMLLIAYALNALKIISQKDIRYKLLNFEGAGLLFYYAITSRSYIFVALEGIWGLVALASILNGHRASVKRHLLK